MLSSPQIKLILMLTIICAEAKKPPGYMEPPKIPDPNPPKYEYGYTIADGKGDGQGKQEQRDGVYALGRYYVKGKDSSQKVQYFADDWGYHPVVEYSSVGPHSKVTSHFALGQEAVQQLKNKENNLPQLQGILENGDKLTTLNPELSLPSQQQQTYSDTSQQGQTSVSPTPTTVFTPEASSPIQQQQTQVLQIPVNHQDNLERQPSQQTETLGQQGLQDQIQQAEPGKQPEQVIVFPQRLDRQKEETQRENSEQFQLQHQQVQNLAVEQNQNLQQNSEGNQLPQLELLQQEQIEQVFVQQPQIQQIPVQELQLQPQQVILKHEEPTQKVIFPQEQQVVYEDIPQDQKQHPNDNIISSEETNQQLNYVQDQESGLQSKPQQLLIQTNIIHTQPAKTNQQLSVEERRYETAALFENSDSKLISTQQVSQTNKASTPYDASVTSRENSANFGSKLTAIQDPGDTTNKLIEHTKNLVSGQDVLNINEAILNDQNPVIDSGTPSSIDIRFSDLQPISSGSSTNTISQIGYTSTTPFSVSGTSFSDQPIVVADLDENVVQSTTEHINVEKGTQQEYYSSTSATEENIASNLIDVTEPSTVLVTPRPISTNFLAPITAGIQLQNIELQAEDKKNTGGINYNVEIQKSVPYYLGKFEYPSVYEQHDTFNETSNEKSSAEIKATENIELGKTLLFFPGQSSSKVQLHLPSLEVKPPPSKPNNYITLQQVPSTIIKNNFVEIDQQQAQGIQHQIAVQHTDQHAQGYQYQVGVQQVNLATVGQVNAQKPIEVTKVIHKPYPVKVPYEVPYPVIKQVQVPVTVQKIIEKPIHITKYVEKPVPIPQPYPVEKIIDRPVHVPVQVTKYIDRPYPVEVRVPYPQPYPVEKVVQKIVKQPYPVEVRVPVPVEKIIERKVPVAHYIDRPVEKIVEKPVPHYVDRPVPVEVKVPVPQPYLVRVEIPKPYPVEVNKVNQNPYGIVQVPQTAQIHAYFIPQKVSSLQTVQVSLPQQTYSQTGYSNSQQEQQAQQSQQTQTYFYGNPYAYAPQINHYLHPKQEIVLNNGYLPSTSNTNGYLPPKKDCNLQASETNTKSIYYTIRPQDYIGLLPPKLSNQVNIVKKLRTARSNFDDKSVRMEYGFMPPLIPSLEIDEQGNPIEKGEK